MNEDFSITQLQNWMQGMLVHHAPMQDTAVSATVEDVINPSQRLSAVRHLDIYRHSYIARLRSCMQSQFSALAYALGNELFELFADQYLDTYPSENYTLNTLGERFPLFLQETRPDAGQEEKESWPDFIIELAGFEYALSVIFDEHADEQYTIAEPDSPDEFLKLVPIFNLFQHPYAICGFYLEFSQGKAPELPFPQETFCAVTRQNYKLGLFTLRPAQYHFLKNMQQGDSVEAAKNRLAETFDYKITDLNKIWPEWKKGFIDAGFFMV